jgi:hypothetical protein
MDGAPGFVAVLKQIPFGNDKQVKRVGYSLMASAYSAVGGQEQKRLRSP